MIQSSSVGLVSEFLRYLEGLNRSVNTLKAYRNDMDHFVRFLVEGRSRAHEDLERAICEIANEMDVQVIADYRTYLAVDRKPSTVSRKIAVLKVFYEWLRKTKGGVAYDLSCDIKSGTRGWKIKLDVFVSADDASRLVAAASGKTLFDARDRTVLHLLCYVGLKTCEISSLNVDSFAGSKLTLRGPFSRVIEVPGDVMRVVEQYLRQYREERDGRLNGSCPFFPNCNFGRLSPRSVKRNILSRYVAIAGLNPLITPGVLRHSLFRRMLDDGMKLEEVKKYLGYRSVRLTMPSRVEKAKAA